MKKDYWKGEERLVERRRTGLERWKHEKMEKNSENRIINPKKIGKSGKTRAKKEKK